MQKGFTLIELMIVIAIVGVLSAVAIFSYQNYTLRVKVSEALIQLSAVKGLIVESYNAGGINSVSALSAEYNARPISSKQSRYVSNIEIASDGVITLTLTSDLSIGLNSDILGKTIKMTPNINGGKLTSSIGSIDWACASNTSVTNKKFLFNRNA